jgi:hypothetical protein
MGALSLLSEATATTASIVKILTFVKSATSRAWTLSWLSNASLRHLKLRKSLRLNPNFTLPTANRLTLLKNSKQSHMRCFRTKCSSRTVRTYSVLSSWL